jgi:ATP-dependent Clp protease ATP-binding subunit ClpA
MADSLAFHARVQRAFTLAQREARAARQATLYPAHLLLGVAREQREHRQTRPTLAMPIVWLRPHPDITEVPVAWKRQNRELIVWLRRLLLERYGEESSAPTAPALSDTSKQALRSACLAARAQQKTTLTVHHLLLGLLDTQLIDAYLLAAITPFMSSLFESNRLDTTAGV